MYRINIEKLILSILHLYCWLSRKQYKKFQGVRWYTGTYYITYIIRNPYPLTLHECLSYLEIHKNVVVPYFCLLHCYTCKKEQHTCVIFLFKKT